MSQNKKRLAELSWELIAHKISYYMPDQINITLFSIPDAEYDAKEVEYKLLCSKLGVKTYTTDMVGVDLTRPSVRLTLDKLNGASLTSFKSD